MLLAFPRQQWLRERSGKLRYTYVTCLVFYFRNFPSGHFAVFGFSSDFSSRWEMGFSCQSQFSATLPTGGERLAQALLLFFFSFLAHSEV
jgi:hypothetical protein